MPVCLCHSPAVSAEAHCEAPDPSLRRHSRRSVLLPFVHELRLCGAVLRCFHRRRGDFRWEHPRFLRDPQRQLRLGREFLFSELHFRRRPEQISGRSSCEPADRKLLLCRKPTEISRHLSRAAGRFWRYPSGSDAFRHPSARRRIPSGGLLYFHPGGLGFYFIIFESNLIISCNSFRLPL